MTFPVGETSSRGVSSSTKCSVSTTCMVFSKSIPDHNYGKIDVVTAGFEERCVTAV